MWLNTNIQWTKKKKLNFQNTRRMMNDGWINWMMTNFISLLYLWKIVEFQFDSFFLFHFNFFPFHSDPIVFHSFMFIFKYIWKKERDSELMFFFDPIGTVVILFTQTLTWRKEKREWNLKSQTQGKNRKKNHNFFSLSHNE